MSLQVQVDQPERAAIVPHSSDGAVAMMTPGSEISKEWYYKLQPHLASGTVDGAKEAIRQLISACRAGHIQLTELQHRRFTTLELCLKGLSDKGERADKSDDLFKTSMLLLLSLVSDAEGSSNEPNPEIQAIMARLRTEPEYVKLRTTIETAKKLTPAAVAKLLKPFAPKMYEETYREALSRCQNTRSYVKGHLFECIVAGVAQQEYTTGTGKKKDG
jgi:hypothetical protein